MPKISNKPLKVINGRILKLRKSKGLTQEQLADILGLKRSTYKYRESNGSFTVEELHKLADYFEVDYSYISSIIPDYLADNDNTVPTRLSDNTDFFQRGNRIVKLSPNEEMLLKSVKPLPDETISEFATILENNDASVQIELLSNFNSLSDDKKEQLLNFIKFLKS